MKPKSWWEKSVDELEREIGRLQAIVKRPDKYHPRTVSEAKRRLPNLKAILAARKGQKPLFPLKEG